MSAAAGEARQTRAPRNASGASVETVTLTMSLDEADAWSVYLAEALIAWKAQHEQDHQMRTMRLARRMMKNKIDYIREQLPEERRDMDADS